MHLFMDENGKIVGLTPMDMDLQRDDFQLAWPLSQPAFSSPAAGGWLKWGGCFDLHLGMELDLSFGAGGDRRFVYVIMPFPMCVSIRIEERTLEGGDTAVTALAIVHAIMGRLQSLAIGFCQS